MSSFILRLKSEIVCKRFLSLQMYCNEVLHNDLLEILSNLLDESLVAIQQNWTQLESCIFAFYSLAEHVDISERKHIPKLMRIIHELPYDTLNDKLLGTALETIGKTLR